MIFKLPKPKQEKRVYKFGDWVVLSKSKIKAEKDLKRFLGAKKFKKVTSE
jgi:hypothetical protein